MHAGSLPHQSRSFRSFLRLVHLCPNALPTAPHAELALVQYAVVAAEPSALQLEPPQVLCRSHTGCGSRLRVA